MSKTNDDGKCQMMIQRKVTRGVMAKGTESFTTRWAWCSRDAIEGDTLCRQHRNAADELQRKLEAKRAKEQKS